MYDHIYDLKDMLCKQLDDYGKKGELTAAVLERVDILAHSAKNLDHIIDRMEESERSERMDGRSYGDRPYRDGNSYDDGRSMARGRGSNVKRDSMGRYSSDGYSRDDDIDSRLRNLERIASQMDR